MLDVRGFFATSGIRILIEMSLISIDSKGGMETREMDNLLQEMGRETIEMHDLLQEMGRKIVQEQGIKDPGKRSRLFNDEDVYRVLRSNTETPNVEAIELYNLQERPLKHADFKNMSNLIMLSSLGKLTDSLDLPDSLRYLYWLSYPLESLPSNFCPENLVELHMRYSKVKKLWKEEQILVNLQVIDLRGCSNLTEVPNLSGSLKIVEINLGRCRSLVEIPSYFQHLDKLTHLELRDCTRLGYLPEMPGNISSDVKYLFKTVRANFIVKVMGESHELFSSKYIIRGCNDGQHHVHVWNEAFRSEEVGKNCSPDVYKLAKEASVVFLCPFSIEVESCGICPLYAEEAEKFKFGHVFMSRGPKVEEETRQDNHSKGGVSGDEPQVSGSSDESEANESD
ncbi:unnamed protein product [Malus baccata var. baccata]